MAIEIRNFNSSRSSRDRGMYFVVDSLLAIVRLFYRTDNGLWCNQSSDGDLHLTGIFSQTRDATVHQIAYTLVVDAHDSTDIIILAMFQIIEVDDLALTGRQFVEELPHAVGERLAVLHLFTVVFIIFGDDLHAGIGNLAVADLGVAAELVVDAVTQRDIEITLNVADIAEAILTRVQFYKHVLDTVFQSLAVGHEARTESEESVDMLVV